MAKRSKPLRVPATVPEAEAALTSIGQLVRSLQKRSHDLNRKIALEKETARINAQADEAELEALVEGLFHYAQANRGTLTDGGKTKSVEFTAGRIGWRTTPPAVQLKNVEAILVACKELGLKQFIRRTPSIDKEAMLKAPEIAETVPGVRIRQHEEFYIRPADVDGDIIGGRTPLKQPSKKRKR